MTALDTYRYVLKELDKHESPTFSVDDFNFFINAAVDQYITKNYGQGDVFEKELDDISVVVKDNVPLTQDTDPTLFLKPNDYRHFLYMNVTVKATRNYRRWKLNDQTVFVLRRQRTNRRGYQEDNAYEQPSEDYPQFRVSNEKFKVLVGPNFTPLSATLMYICKATTIFLDPTASSGDFGNPAKNSVIQFPDYVAKEIVRWCSRIFLENIESPRYRTALSEQQIRQE